MKNYIKPERISLKDHPEFNENWVQDRIAEDPSIIGVGDVVLRDKERIQPRAGRLDLLLQDTETQRRYEVEVQLGTIDEAHIIRTIEYWDIERQRYPQYDHCAVIIAEDITSRFLNVISLFNGTIPLIAIQMQAYYVGDAMTLVFTKVLDEMSRGLVDEDEDAESAPADRSYWEKKTSKVGLTLSDSILDIQRSLDKAINLKYNKFYIGFEKDGKSYNYVLIKPKRNRLVFEITLPKSDDIDKMIETAGLDSLEYNPRWGRYRLRLTKEDIEKKQDVLKELSTIAYNKRMKF